MKRSVPAFRPTHLVGFLLTVGGLVALSATPAAGQDTATARPPEPGLTYLSRHDFMALVDDGLQAFAQDHPRAKEGWWEFTMGGRSYELYDFGDSLQLTFYIDARELPREKRDAFLETVRARVAQRAPPGAASAEVEWYPEYIHLLWVKAAYVLDGSFGASEMKARYEDFMYGYARDLGTEIHRIMAEMGGAPPS